MITRRRGAKAVVAAWVRAWKWKWFGVEGTSMKTIRHACPECGRRPRQSPMDSEWAVYLILVVFVGAVALYLNVQPEANYPAPYGAPTGQCWDGAQGASYPC